MNKGYWIRQNGAQKLLWVLNGEFISDAALRTWIFHNNHGYDKYAGPCVLEKHVNQYINREE